MANKLEFKYKYETCEYEFEDYIFDVHGEVGKNNDVSITVMNRNRNGEITKVIYTTIEEAKAYLIRNYKNLIKVYEDMLNE